MQIKSIFRSFKHLNYRYYFIGQGISLVGTWMQATALGWLIYRMSGSSLKLGIIGFLNMFPSLVFGYIAGVISDRIDRKKGLYFTQTASMLSAFMITFLFFYDKIQIWHIMLISFINGISAAFDMPFRQSFVIEMVGREELPNALALNSIMFNSSRLIGPAIAGFIIKYYSEGVCFLINFISYFFIIIALIKIKPYLIENLKKKSDTFYDDIKRGLNYVNKVAYIKYPLIFIMMLSLITMPIITLLPVYVKYINADSRVLGFFISSIGLGAIISGLQMAKRKENRSLALMIFNFSLIYGLAIFMLSFSKNIYISILFLFIAGVGTSRQMIGINTLIQSLVKEEYRGRVMSIYALSFSGLTPFGNLLWGYLSDKIGIKDVLILCSLWVFIANIWFIYKMSSFKRILTISKDSYDLKEYENIKELI